MITTRYCPWEFLNETHTGWCIDLSVDNLTNTLRQAMGMNADKLYEMGQKASLLVSEKFDYRSVAKKTMEMYRSALMC